jgi:hypothetical protein
MTPEGRYVGIDYFKSSTMPDCGLVMRWLESSLTKNRERIAHVFICEGCGRRSVISEPVQKPTCREVYIPHQQQAG